MLNAEERIVKLLEYVGEDTFEPNVFELISKGFLDVDGEPLFYYIDKKTHDFTSVDINGNIRGDRETINFRGDVEEDEDMNKTTAQNLINLTRAFDNLYKNGKISNSDDADEILAELAESEKVFTSEEIEKILTEKFPLEELYDLLKVTGSRLRVVEEQVEFYVLVKKGYGEKEAEKECYDYVVDNYDENSNLEWEVNDEEYELRDFAVSDIEVEDTDTYDNLEGAYDIEGTLE